MDVDSLTIYVLVEVEEVGFDATFFSVEGRAASDADGAGVLSARDRRATRVDPFCGNQLGGVCEIGGWKTDFATATVAVNDLGTQAIGSPEAGRRVAHAPLV